MQYVLGNFVKPDINKTLKYCAILSVILNAMFVFFTFLQKYFLI